MLLIYLRALCWASYRKSNKYITSELAYPMLRDGPCRYSFNLPQTIRFVSEPSATIRNFSSYCVKYLDTIRIKDHFRKWNSRIYFLFIFFQSFN